MVGAELSKLITWKLRVRLARLGGIDRRAQAPTGAGHMPACFRLQRGSFRPGLQQMVDRLAAEEVRSATTAAYKALPDLSRALAAATTLKGVGPALGSAVLRAFSDAAPYMSDEALAAVPELGAIKYTPAHYLAFAEHLQRRATALGAPWTAATVEKALWAAAIVAKHGGGSSGGKTPAAGDDDAAGAPAKKRRQA